MKIEEGKFYRTRDGEKVGPILPYDGDGFPFRCGIYSYNSYGGYYSRGTSPRDLIAEWTDEPDTPKTWGDMTDAEKVALLLDWNDNHARNVQQWNGTDWMGMQTGRFGRLTAYRIKPEPVVETVTIAGNGKEWREDAFFWPPIAGQTHRITFDTIDGKPDLASIKMEEV